MALLTHNDAPSLLVTTSWDDGHPLDLRVAERLAAHGVTGTFYVPVQYSAVERMSLSRLRQLRAMGMEVGSHTVSHPRLSEVGDDIAFRELRESRDALENILGEPVTSFCYPEGKLRPGLAELVQAAGYTLARTTLAFRNDLSFDPLAMPVSMQLYPHSRAVLARHALHEGNLSGLFAWVARLGRISDPAALAERMLADMRHRGGIFHVWGHSWEIEDRGLWPVLDRILEAVSRERGAQYLTNSGVLAALSPRTKTKYAVALQN